VGVEAFMAGESRTLDVSFKGLTVERNAQGLAEVRSLLTTTATAPIPTSFRSVLYQHLVAASAIRQVATVLTTTGGEPIILPKTTAHPANGTIVAEAAGIGESDPTFGQGTLTSYKYGNIIQISNENLADSGVNLESYIAQAMGRSLGLGSGHDLVVGTGSSQPQGVLVGAGTIAQVVGGTPAASGATFSELVSVYDKIIPPYQVRGSWFLSQSALSKLRALVNTQGTPLFQESLHAETQTSIFGRPVLVDVAMPAVGTSATSIAFGDFSAYYVRDTGVRFERSVDYAFGTDLVTYRALLRCDGRLLDLTGAIATYKCGTA
jgi:HK97 family phage major capsid protein